MKMTKYRLVMSFLSVAMVATIGLYQNCGGTTVGQPSSTEVDLPLPTDESLFKAYDAYPFDDDNMFSPGEEVTPHLLELTICIRGFRLSDQAPIRPVNEIIEENTLDPLGTFIGFFQDVIGFGPGLYPQSTMGLADECGMGYGIRIVNGNGTFVGNSLYRFYVPIDKVHNADGTFKNYEIEIQEQVTGLSQVTDASQLHCALKDRFVCPEGL